MVIYVEKYWINLIIIYIYQWHNISCTNLLTLYNDYGGGDESILWLNNGKMRALNDEIRSDRWHKTLSLWVKSKGGIEWQD